MARCGCNQSCACAVIAGENVTVTGNGSTTNPYVINAVPSSIGVLGTDCLDMTISGLGTEASPYIISASPKISAAAGNALTCTPAGLFVSANGVTVGCGLADTGTAIEADTATPQDWIDSGYICTERDDNGQQVYCTDAAGPNPGRLFVEPRPDPAPFRFSDSGNPLQNVGPGVFFCFTSPVFNFDPNDGCFPLFDLDFSEILALELDLTIGGTAKDFRVTFERNIDGAGFVATQAYRYNDVPGTTNQWSDRRQIADLVVPNMANAAHTIQFRVCLDNLSPNTIVVRNFNTQVTGYMTPHL